MENGDLQSKTQILFSDVNQGPLVNSYSVANLRKITIFTFQNVDLVNDNEIYICLHGVLR